MFRPEGEPGLVQSLIGFCRGHLGRWPFDRSQSRKMSVTSAETAREHRIGMARQWANGLRISAKVSDAPSQSAVVSVVTREFPAMVSPVSGRKDGGGYQPFHPDDPAMVAELRRQGAQSLRAWLARFRGVAEMGGLDVGPIEQIAAQMTGGVEVAA